MVQLLLLLVLLVLYVCDTITLVIDLNVLSMVATQVRGRVQIPGKARASTVSILRLAAVRNLILINSPSKPNCPIANGYYYITILLWQDLALIMVRTCCAWQPRDVLGVTGKM